MTGYELNAMNRAQLARRSSDKTARAEFALTLAEIIAAIRAGNISKFQHRVPDDGGSAGRLSESFFQETPPELVVEVASARTRLYDRNRKKDIYEGFGIPAYWIVELSSERPELTVFELRSGAYEQTAHVIGGEEYRAAVPFPVNHRAVPARDS